MVKISKKIIPLREIDIRFKFMIKLKILINRI